MKRDLPSTRHRNRRAAVTARQGANLVEATEFVAAALMADLPVGTGKAVDIAGDAVALFNVDGAVYAIDDWDLDKGTSIAAGQLAGTIARSRNGRLSYDVTTGEVVGVPGLSVDVYEVRVVEGTIMVATRRRRGA